MLRLRGRPHRSRAQERSADEHVAGLALPEVSYRLHTTGRILCCIAIIVFRYEIKICPLDRLCESWQDTSFANSLLSLKRCLCLPLSGSPGNQLLCASRRAQSRAHGFALFTSTRGGRVHACGSHASLPASRSGRRGAVARSITF